MEDGRGSERIPCHPRPGTRRARDEAATVATDVRDGDARRVRDGCAAPTAHTHDT